MEKYRVKVEETQHRWATVEATDLENAIHLVRVALFLDEEQMDDEADEAVQWDFPQQLDTVACSILAVVKEGGG